MICCRTPSYAAPEVFIDPKTASFQADIWSLSASLFHLVSSQLPFESSTPIIASVNISDMGKPAPDIREKTPPGIYVSPGFAAAIAKGLEKSRDKRYRSVDEMSTALHRCLVIQNEDSYSIFISSSDLIRDKLLAFLLFKALNNTETEKGKRVFVCMRPIELRDAEIWEEFPLCIQKVKIAVPIFSNGMLESMNALKGSVEDPVHRFLKELILMHILSQDPYLAVKKIIPVCMDQVVISMSDLNYNLVPRESPQTISAVQKFLKAHLLSTEKQKISIYSHDNISSSTKTDTADYSVDGTIKTLLLLPKKLQFHELSSEKTEDSKQSTSLNTNKHENQEGHQAQDTSPEDELEDSLLEEFEEVKAMISTSKEANAGGDDWKSMIRTMNAQLTSLKIKENLQKELDSVCIPILLLISICLFFIIIRYFLLSTQCFSLLAGA